MYKIKFITFLILLSIFSLLSSAQKHIVLSKTKKDGTKKAKTIKLNQRVKVFYVSTERLSMSDRPPIVLYKKKMGDNYIGLADGKLIEINEEFLLIQRVATKDLITVPVKEIIALGRYNLFKRIATLTVASLGTAVTLDYSLEQKFGKGYDTSLLLGSMFIATPFVINAIDKTIFPAHKLNREKKGFKLSIQ